MEIRYLLAKKATVYQLADLSSWKGEFLVLETKCYMVYTHRLFLSYLKKSRALTVCMGEVQRRLKSLHQFS